ncbi:hypothetical protein AB9P05_22210 [Roseivirga sp. BDSF3-8]|uniref:hypothetical protein n=1 Tax=Roseivirga sp. BDSF3-8 TaxID=3241598 RepID=UPI00353246A9
MEFSYTEEQKRSALSKIKKLIIFNMLIAGILSSAMLYAKRDELGVALYVIAAIFIFLAIFMYKFSNKSNRVTYNTSYVLEEEALLVKEYDAVKHEIPYSDIRRIKMKGHGYVIEYTDWYKSIPVMAGIQNHDQLIEALKSRSRNLVYK